MSTTFLHTWFSHPWALALLGLLPTLALLFLWNLRRRRRALTQLGNWFPLNGSPRSFRWLLTMIGCLALVLLILGMAGPQWGREPNLFTVPGRDLVLVLDMSQSMLAEDVLGKSSPNRLGRGRDVLLDLVDSVEKRGGHRLAVVVFAARPKVLCPLTQDYDHLRHALKTADLSDLIPDIGPTAQGPPSGTRLGAALREAALLHDSRFAGYQDILIVSDGDDPAGDEEWRIGIDAARDRRIPIHAVGVGNPDKGSPIPTKDGLLRHQGLEVATRLEEATLQEIARTTGGTYTPAQTRDINLGELFRTTIEPRSSREMEEDRLPRYRQRYAWFFAAALTLFLITLASPIQRSGAMPTALCGQGSTQGDGVKKKAFMVVILALAVMSAGPPSDPLELVRQGNEAVAQGQFDAALALYTQAEAAITDPGLVAFNKAVVYYRLKKFSEAASHFERCLEDAEGSRKAHALYNLGNTCLTQAGPKDAKLLTRAIDLYQDSLKMDEVSPDLAEAARHNLELANILLAVAKKTLGPDAGNPENPENPKPRPPNQEPKEPKKKGGNGDTGDPKRAKSGAGADPAKNEPGEGMETTEPPPPGAGNLPPIPDTDHLVPMSPADTSRYLQETAERIARERRSHRQRSSSPPRQVMDW